MTILAEWAPQASGSYESRKTKFLVWQDAPNPADPTTELGDTEAAAAAIAAATTAYLVKYPGNTAEYGGGYYAGLPLFDYSVEMKGVYRAEVELTYTYGQNNSSNTGQPYLSLNIESSLESVTIKHGIANRAVFRTIGGSFGGQGVGNIWGNSDQYDTILNPSIEGQAEGIQIQVPVIRFKYTYSRDYFITTGAFFDFFSSDYENRLANLTGRVNLTTFAGRPANSVRFDGGSGGVNSKGEVEFTWSFTRRALAIPTGLPSMELVRFDGAPIDYGPESDRPQWFLDLYGGAATWPPAEVPIVLNPVYDGWDTLSVIWSVTEEDGELTVLPIPQVASIIRTLPRAEFTHRTTGLQIPGVNYVP
jgi:hypothetical protein